MWDLDELYAEVQRNWTYYQTTLPDWVTDEGSRKFKEMGRFVRDQASKTTMDFEVTGPSKTVVLYAYEFYMLAYRAKLEMLLLGPAKSRQMPEEVKNFGISSNINFRSQTIGNADLSAEMKKYGSIMSENNYCHLFNDLWILGGVHCCIQFQLISFPSYPTTYNSTVNPNTLWRSKTKRLGMLGRELVILHHFGYRRVQTTTEQTPLTDPTLGLVFVPGERVKAEGATLTSFVQIVDQYEGADDVKALLQKYFSYEMYYYRDVKAKYILQRAIIIYQNINAFGYPSGRWMNVSAGVLQVDISMGNHAGGKFCKVNIEQASYDFHEAVTHQKLYSGHGNVTGYVSSSYFAQPAQHGLIEIK